MLAVATLAEFHNIAPGRRGNYVIEKPCIVEVDKAGTGPRSSEQEVVIVVVTANYVLPSLGLRRGESPVVYLLDKATQFPTQFVKDRCIAENMPGSTAVNSPAYFRLERINAPLRERGVELARAIYVGH
jgi:hypothetical protein